MGIRAPHEVPYFPGIDVFHEEEQVQQVLSVTLRLG